MSDINRREFVAVTIAGAFACMGSPAGAQPTQPAQPDVSPVDAGPLESFAADGVTDTFSEAGRFLLIRQEGRLYAASSRCTHKRCTIRWVEETLRCPCHGSLYDLSGVPTLGPATQSLFRFAIGVEGGRVLVNRAKQFDEKDWENHEAFIEVK